MLLGLHTRLSLAAVTWIRVTLQYLDAAALVEGVLKHTPQLTHLEMWATSCVRCRRHRNAGKYFLGEHIVLCRALPVSARDPVLCPALHSLTLRYDGLSGAEHSERYEGAVETMLASRAAAGQPLRSLFPRGWAARTRGSGVGRRNLNLPAMGSRTRSATPEPSRCSDNGPQRASVA